MANWKQDPQVFLRMKIKYATLLGFLQGYAFAGKRGEEYVKVYDKVNKQIIELAGEIFNCGWSEECPTIEEIIQACDEVNEDFPVIEEKS